MANLKVDLQFDVTDGGTIKLTDDSLAKLRDTTASTVDAVKKFADEQAKTAAVGQAFEDILKSQGLTLLQFQLQQAAVAEGANQWTDAMQREAMAMSAAQDAALKMNAALDESHSNGEKLQEIFANALGVGAALSGFALLETALEKGKELLEALTFGTMEYAHATEVMAQKMGMTTKQVQELQYAADVTGGNMQSLARGVLNMQSQIEAGSPRVIAALEALKLNPEDIGAMSTADAITAINNALQGLDENTQRIDLKNLLGRGAIENIALFSSNLEELKGQAEAAGAVLDEETLKTLAENEKAWIAVKDAVAGLVHALGGLASAAGVGTFFDSMSGGLGIITEKVQLFTKMWRDLRGGSANSDDLKNFFSLESAQPTGGGHGGATSGPPGMDPGTAALLSKLGADISKDNTKSDTAAAKAAEKLAQEQLNAATKESIEFTKTYNDLLGVDAEETVKLADEQAKAISPLDGIKQKNQDVYEATMKKIDGYLVDASMLAILNPAEAENFVAMAQAAQAARDKAVAIRDGADAAATAAQADKDLTEHQKELASSAQQVKKDGEDFMRSWIKHLQEVEAAQKKVSDEWKHMGSLLGQLPALMEAFGASADSVMARLAGVGSTIAGSIGTILDPKADIFSKIGAGISALTSVVGFVKSLFGPNEGERIGNDFGGALSDALVKQIMDTESKLHLGRALAEDLNIDAILKETGADPSTMSDRISDLMNAVAMGAVPAKDGIAALGKAFTDLKTAADGGSVASEAAMVKMILRARELGQSIPELDAAVAQMLDDANKGLQQFYEGITPEGGKAGAGGAKQGAASQVLFDAVYNASIGQLGLSETMAKFQATFDAMRKSMAPGTKLTGDAAEFAHLEKLMKNKEFSGAASGAEGLAKTTQGLLDSGNLTQQVVNALGTSMHTLFNQALHGAEKAGDTPARAQLDALKAILPELVQLQHAQELGAHLTKEQTERLEQARAAGLLPMKTLAEQQLDYTKQIAANTAGGRGYGAPPGGAPGAVHAALGYDGITPNLGGGYGPLIQTHAGERVKIGPVTGGGGNGGPIVISMPISLAGARVNMSQKDLEDGMIAAARKGGEFLQRLVSYQNSRGPGR